MKMMMMMMMNPPESKGREIISDAPSSVQTGQAGLRLESDCSGYQSFLSFFSTPTRSPSFNTNPDNKHDL